MLKGKTSNMSEELKENVVKESSIVYGKTPESPVIYINPFEDWVFKRIFASESSKEVAKAFLNVVLEGKRYIESITYGKNEYPGEIRDEGNSVFDFICKDKDGVTFLVEVQRQEQKNFKERSLFYTSRLISDQSPKGYKEWRYNLKEIYSISLLENFSLPETKPGKYLHNVSLCDTDTGSVFYNKLHFTYIEVAKFNKKEHELKTLLDEWLYALKHASTMEEVPHFLKAPQLDQFFHLARYANLTQDERNMFRTAQQVKWDEQNVRDFAIEKGIEKGIEKKIEKEIEKASEKVKYQNSIEIAKALLADGIPVSQIAKCTRLSEEEVAALK